MSSYDKAAALLSAEHKIVRIVYLYVDRMNDPGDVDTLDSIVGEFIEAVSPAIDEHLRAVRNIGA